MHTYIYIYIYIYMYIQRYIQINKIIYICTYMYIVSLFFFQKKYICIYIYICPDMWLDAAPSHVFLGFQGSFWKLLEVFQEFRKTIWNLGFVFWKMAPLWHHGTIAPPKRKHNNIYLCIYIYIYIYIYIFMYIQRYKK